MLGTVQTCGEFSLKDCIGSPQQLLQYRTETETENNPVLVWNGHVLRDLCNTSMDGFHFVTSAGQAHE